MAFSIQYAGAYVACFSVSAIICFFFGSCQLIKSFTKDITQDLIHFNVNAASNGNYALKKQMLCNISQNISDITQLSFENDFFAQQIMKVSSKVCSFKSRRLVKEFNAIYEFIITDFFLWMIAVLCGSLLTLQFELVKLAVRFVYEFLNQYFCL